jgi:hypothetical protein
MLYGQQKIMNTLVYVLSFPSLSWLDADQSKALSGIVELIADAVAYMIRNNEKVPNPFSEKI